MSEQTITNPNTVAQISPFELKARKAFGAGALVCLASTSLVACGGDSGRDLSYLGEIEEAAASEGSAGAEGLPGTVLDGSDAAIAAAVESGLTNCGGLGGKELWTDKPYTPNHLFGFYEQNPDMVESTQKFWTNVMGADALGFITEKAVANKDADTSLADTSLKVSGNADLTTFTQKHIASIDVPEGTIERNHNCVDTDGDGKADTIKFLDLREARHGNHSVEGTKRTTLAGLVLSHEDFKVFVQKMRDAGKDPEQLIHYTIRVDENGDKVITTDEVFEFVATSSAICENPVLKGERPTPVTTVTSTPPGRPTTTFTVPTTVPKTTSTTAPRTSNTVTDNTTIEQPGAGGTPDNDNNPNNNVTTSTTAEPAPNSSTSTTSAQSVTSTTLGECGEACE